MTDSSQVSASSQPPPAPPLPPSRAGGVFQKFIAPLSFNIGGRPHGSQAIQSAVVSPSTNTNRIYKQLPSQTTAHRTGISIAAIDINKAKTHAILAGQEILKTVHVHAGRMVEELNVRSAIVSYAPAYTTRSETANQRREYLPAKDVVWSKGSKFDSIIATAANNGRIALYDLNSSRVELNWIHDHSGQVNKLDFDPVGGYYLLSGSQDKTVKIWDIREPQTVRRKQNINVRQPVRDVRWSPTDPGEFALCTENGVVQRWDLRMPSGALLSINAHEKECYAIDWHPDGRHLVSGGFDKYAKVWDFKSENRRQKPAFQLRAPQKILNVRWRPPCWSLALAEKGHWESAQLATSYTEEDPRIHIWDLRRPLLPYREQDRYGSRPTDMLWASEDYLWSVGSQGMFMQTDVRYATLVQEELSTSAVDFMPDGSFVAFSEDTRRRRTSSVEDPAAGFLRIPQERLSGGTDGAISRSISDDDDDAEDGLLTTSARRHVHKSTRSAKSQGNTPPTGDGSQHVVPLDRAVLNRKGFFNNQQSGIKSNIRGVAAELEIVDFLAENYARAMALEERKEAPSRILEKLHQAFSRNANACEYVSMHRMAQSWRILDAVVIPELRSWADLNRNNRLELEAKRKLSVNESKSSTLTRNFTTNPLISKTKIMSNLFKGVTESERYGSDPESTSNMTTPMARPLPDSPLSSHNQGHTFLNLNETIEPIAPLPPSVVASHSTAAAASKALFETRADESPASSPERPRRPGPLQQHRRTVTDIPIIIPNRSIQNQGSRFDSVNKQFSTPPIPQSPRMELRKQEDRRAAIRDFRGQQRQLFTFDEPIQSPKYTTTVRHDSNESFPMFSASTDSSHRARSLGQSIDFPKDQIRVQHDSEDWQSIRIEDAMETPASGNSNTSHEPQRLVDDDEFMQEHFPMDETSRLDFGLDGVAKSQPKSERSKVPVSASMWDIGELPTSSSLSQSETPASSASDALGPFEEVSNVRKLKIYTSNPIRRIITRADTTVTASSEISEEEATDSKDYVFSDFRPIDFTIYEPKLPWAWSALPLICHSIAFDISEGIANAQFSVHLLMHLHPFFFHPKQGLHIQPGIAPPDSIAERLMRPDLSHRVIEGLFLNHYLYLKKLGLYKSMTELRKICVDHGFNEAFKQGATDQPVGASLKQDPYHLQTSCSHCYSFMQSGVVMCVNCGHSRSSCPICLQLHSTSQNSDVSASSKVQEHQNLWTFCQACGHGAHWTCMQDWMLQPDTQGECPTRGCGCDCGPGLVRKQRIAQQLADAENSEIIRGGRGSAVTKRDPVRASPSPAVDKTRDTLRNSEVTRDSSGDERMRRSFSGRGGSRGGMSTNGGASRGASQSFGRRVRLVTPGEENGPSYSAS